MPRRSRSTIFRYTAAVVINAMIALILVACGNNATTAAVATCAHLKANSGTAITWVVPASLLQYHPGAERTLINRAFGNDHTYVYGGPPGRIGVPTARYASYAQMLAAFSEGTLPGKYKAVIYDNERWPATPIAEQEDPSYYEGLVARLLHQQGLIYIAAPAPDLMWATGKPADSYTAYLQSNVAGDAAGYANVIDIQGQVRETDLQEFVSFVTTAVRQSRDANPSVKVLIGLRTNPGNQQLLAAYRAVAGLADGYWLNVNGSPEVAIDFLSRIYCSSSSNRLLPATQSLNTTVNAVKHRERRQRQG